MGDNKKARVICLTPVKNEEWIIERFVKAASLWADIIIIADQMSTDGTGEIARRYPKVRVIENCSTVFNENERQKLLINEARKIEGKKLLIAMDADEFLTSNFHDSLEWNQMLYAEPGTVFCMKWPFIKADFQHYWETEEPYNKFAVVDDGSPHIGTAMHSVRIPVPSEPKEVYLNDIKVMHFQYTDWNRMESKHLWYQCYERVTYPEKSIFEIYRTYHHMYIAQTYKEIPEKWFEYYENSSVKLLSMEDQEKYWWDEEIERYIREYGKEYFKYIDIKENFNLILLYLRNTQPLYKGKYRKAILRRLDKILNLLLKKE